VILGSSLIREIALPPFGHVVYSIIVMIVVGKGIFWGIAILLHASRVFIFRGKFLGEKWEEEKIRDLMEKEERSKR
jgi:hypothetical protein